jgi:SAM-dependent methyltransferase
VTPVTFEQRFAHASSLVLTARRIVRPMKRSDWDEQAQNWIAWVRELNDDAYRDYAPAFLDTVSALEQEAHDDPRIGPHDVRALDLGCGEGRSARDLAATTSGATYGVDASWTLVEAAHDAGGNVRYVNGDAATLPFRDESFDLVTAYNVLMDLDDLDAALDEIARVLKPQGSLAACVLHPMAEAGTFDAREPGARYVIDGSYFDEGSYRLTFERRGHDVTFSSSRYTLESYVGALARAGFTLSALHEPRPDAAAIARDPAEERWTRVPLFLFLLAEKRAPRSSA